MFSSQSLPESIAEQLPSTDRRSRFVRTGEGDFVVAGSHGLFVLNENGPQSSGLWHEIQYASWKADTRRLTVVWTEAGREPFIATTVEENPEKFMRVLTSRVDRALVVSRQKVTPSGAVLTATVRRRPDDVLFSTVMVQGELSESEEPLARQLENAVRDEVGLEPA